VLTKGEKKGNLILGPTARDLHVPSHMNESREDVQRFILAKCRKLVDAFDPSKFFFFFFFFFLNDCRGGHSFVFRHSRKV
jgi:hypothetical protein